jgi:hypothetical protein
MENLSESTKGNNANRLLAPVCGKLNEMPIFNEFCKNKKCQRKK